MNGFQKMLRRALFVLTILGAAFPAYGADSLITVGASASITAGSGAEVCADAKDIDPGGAFDGSWCGEALPAVTTQAVTHIGTNTATGNGNITALGAPNPTQHGMCWNTTGSPTTSNNKTQEGPVNSPGTFTSGITGLSPNTTYYVRAYATNTAGTAYGEERPFVSALPLPVATTAAATSVSTDSATLNGTVNPNGAATVTFEYGTTTGYGSTATASQSPISGTTSQAVSKGLTGLSPGITYHYRVKATNPAGTTHGSDMTFTTIFATAPTVTTTGVSSITPNSASTGGNVTSNGGAAVTGRGVCWSTSANPTTSDSKTSDGTGTGTFTSAITGLSPGQTYHVRAYAKNSAGTAYGTDLTVTTQTATPTVITAAVTSITNDSASGGGNITSDGGAAVTARGVCWNTNGNPTISDSKTSDGTGTGTFTSAITGLSLGQTYHVRAYAKNSAGTAYGTDLTITTQTVTPTVITAAVTSITNDSASGGGNITSDGGAAVTARGVCWNTNGNPTTADNKSEEGVVSATGPFTAHITGLDPETQYHIRAYAVNSAGTAYGGEVSFTTLPNTPSVPTATAATAVTWKSFSANWTTATGATGYRLDVSTQSDFSSYVTGYRDKDVGNATTFSVTDLSPVTEYFYRVRPVNEGGMGENSNTISVGTTDGTGVPAEIQDAAPNNGDGNGDDIRDSRQTTVASLPSAAPGAGYMTVELTGCGQIHKVAACACASVGKADPGYTYPFDLVGFEIPCGSATVRIYYHGATHLQEYCYRKYGPTPTDWNIPVWYNMPGCTFGNKVIGAKTVPYAEFLLTEALLGDDTPVFPIVDQGGVALPNAIPTMNEWGLIILGLIMFGIALGAMGRRRAGA